MRKNLFILTIALFGLATSSFAQGYACYGNGKVWVHKVGESPKEINSAGQHACFSADGKKVFFNVGSEIWAIDNDGKNGKKIGTHTTGSGACFCAYRPEPQTVLVREGNEFHKINVNTLEKALIFKGNASIYGELAIATDAVHVAGRVGSPAKLTISNQAGSWSNYSGGCSASISPDGKYVTQNGGSHKTMIIHNFSGGTFKTINNTAGGTWDNQRFAANSNDHIAVLFDNGVGSNKGKKVGFHLVSSDKTTVVGSVSGGDTQYPDFWLGDLPEPGTTAVRTSSTAAALRPCFSFSKQGMLMVSPVTSGSYTFKLINAKGAVIRSFAGTGSNVRYFDLSDINGLAIVKMQADNATYIQKIIQ